VIRKGLYSGYRPSERECCKKDLIHTKYLLAAHRRQR
jgi:hypothetical protein